MNPQTSLRKHLIRGASGSLVLRIANTALTLLMAVVLARVLGVENFGIYAFCLSVVQILTVPAMLGGQQLLVREVAAYQTKGEYHFLRGLLLRFRQASFLASVLLALAVAGIGYIVYQDSPMLIPFLVAAAIIPLNTTMQLQGAALRGLRHVLWGQAALTIRPALVLAIVGSFFWMTGRKLGAEAALSAQLAASAVLVALSFLLLQRLLPREAKNAKSDYETSRWVKSAFPFVFASGMQVLNNETSVVLLGILQAPEVVGLFRVAQRGAMLIPFGLQAVNMAMGPTVAEMFAKGEKKRLQSMISKSILVVLAFAIPVALLLILGGRWILPFVFGQDYAPAYLPLIILCLGQLFNAGMGSVGVILNMAGLERFTARGVAIAAVASVVLNATLIPIFGAIGAAIATSTSLMIWNTLLFIWLYKETGIVSIIRFSST
ncbi:MAG: flippase [Desulfobacteraceae bacterium]|nr:flippase [Desulfobacteraceae bacterium]